MLIAKSPKGHLIQGTAEIIKGTAGVTFGVGKDGAITWDYDGSGTAVDWNSQETEKRDGRDLFICENGQLWTLDQLTIEDDGEAEDDETD